MGVGRWGAGRRSEHVHAACVAWEANHLAERGEGFLDERMQVGKGSKAGRLQAASGAVYRTGTIEVHAGWGAAAVGRVQLRSCGARRAGRGAAREGAEGGVLSGDAKGWPCVAGFRAERAASTGRANAGRRERYGGGTGRRVAEAVRIRWGRRGAQLWGEEGSVLEKREFERQTERVSLLRERK